MVSRVGKFVGGLGVDVTNVANVHATENRIALGASINPTANVHVVGNAHVSTTFSTGGNITSGGSVTGTSADFDGGVTIDNITIDGTEIDLSSGDLTIDSAGTIILDHHDIDGIHLQKAGDKYLEVKRSGDGAQFALQESNADFTIMGLTGSAGSLAGYTHTSFRFHPNFQEIDVKVGNVRLSTDTAKIMFGASTSNTVDLRHTLDKGLYITEGLGLAGNTSPLNNSLSIGQPANVVIRTHDASGKANIIVGDATATSGFNLDVRGTANVGALTSLSHTSTGAIQGTTLTATADGGVQVPNDGNIGSAGATDAMQISSGGIVTFKDDILIKDDGTIGSASAATAMTIDSSGIVTFVDDIKIKDGGTIGVASAADAMTVSSAGIVTFKDDILIKDGGTIGVASKADAITVASDGKVTLVEDAAVTGNAIVSLGLGLAGNTIPSSDGVSFGTPANVVIRTFAGSGNVIIGDATATSGFSLDVRGTANTGALTASGLAFPTSDGSSGQVIKTDGSGALSFTDIATDLDPATELASDTDCGTATSATDSVDAFGIAINNSFVELDLRTQGANKLGTVDMGAF